MNSVREPALHLQDVPRLFSKYWVAIGLAALLGTILGLVASHYVPKKYKAHFVLTIYSKYFQSPLIGDFVPGISESGEMRSQREALIRQIITAEFLDTLGTQYNIYGSGKTNWLVSFLNTVGQALGLIEITRQESLLSAQREGLRKRIEIYSVNNTTFNVGFLYSDPDVTLKVTQDIYRQVIQSLLDVRSRIIGNVRNAVQSRLSSLTPSRATSIAGEPTEEQYLANELAEVRRELRSLTAQYTEEHPLVLQMRDRERILASRVKTSGRVPPSRPANVTVGSGTGEPARDMYGDLLKKLNYLDIAMDTDRRHQSDYFAILETPLYPSAPLWPKKGLLAIWGFALGFFGSLFIVALKEYFDRSTLHADTIAQQLGVPVLGELPAFPSHSRQP
jgi:uncharacterized protein involved in exopolysaccharide biosynthesis